MTNSLISDLQCYIAVTSVGASTVRGSPSGTVKACRDFLTQLSLSQFGVKSKKVFYRNLDLETENLKVALPRGRRHWALARKVLNIFLHNVFYNHYLRKRYNLDAAEQYYEVPIDSVVARGIRKRSPRGTFERWVSLKVLGPEEHEKYQLHADLLANKKQYARVHLDAVLWVQER